MNNPAASVTVFTLGPFDSHDAMLTKCIEVCQNAGLTVLPPPAGESDWTTIAALARKFGCSNQALSYALNHAKCPRYTVDRSDSGRILSFRLNPDTSAWLLGQLKITTTTQL